MRVNQGRGLAVAGIVLAVVILQARQTSAQVVQLPTQQVFSVGTTVMVPDRGSMSLGGISRLREGSASRGVPLLGQVPGLGRLFKNKGIGRETSNQSARVHAYIIDLDEQEAALLSKAGIPRLGEDPQVAKKADFLSRHVARTSAPPQRKYHHRPTYRKTSAQLARRPAPSNKPSLAEIKRQNEQAVAKQSADAARFFAQGQQAEKDGKSGVAKIFYQMAARRSKGTDLHLQVAARLQALEEAAKSKSRLAGK